MQVQSTHEVIGHALDAIVAKGGNHLYGTYIKQKLPNHANQQAQDLLTTNFNLVYHNEPKQSTISCQRKPVNAAIDINTPQKVIHKRTHSQLESHPTNKNLIRMKQSINANKSLLENSNIPQNLKPNICIKYGCQKESNIQKIDENKLRREKVKSIKKQTQQAAEKARQQAKRSYRRKQLESKIEELTVQGIPYGYDDSGHIFNMDVAEFKEKQKQQSKERKNNLFELKFRTLDVNTARYNPQENFNVTGRKRGFTSTKFYKKLRMTDDQFNNQNNRQYSTIPFATIAEGVKIIEKEKNIIASKTKESTVSRDQFVKETQSRFFKSFMPDSDGALSFGGFSERPMTTGQFNRTKQTAQTGTGRSLRKSILWRPHTTSKTCRLNINNRELARQFVNS